MGSGVRRHPGATRARWVRGLAALALVSSIASTGVTALAGPVSAAASAPIIGFLLLQNQIDGRDPKLASAPVGAELELGFGPALRANPVGRTWGRGAPP